MALNPDPVDVSRFPLDWPLGWPRTANWRRCAAKFRVGGRSLTVGDGATRLMAELRRLGARAIVISSNLQVKPNGVPYAQQARLHSDPGTAVYFQFKGKNHVLACDKWKSAADNLAAIAGHIDAIRTMDRYGVGSIEQAFAGYKALPADSAADWKVALFGANPPSPVTLSAVHSAYRQLAGQYHPDITGDDGGKMAWLNRAREYAVAALEGR